jgi:threonine/homoserine/homoserine lactone efflux protein
VLIVLGVQAMRRTDRGPRAAGRGPTARSAYGNGLVTSFANPKLAVFFIALFPQFVPDGAPVLPVTLAMALLLIAVDLVYFTLLALAVSRAHRAVVGSRLARRLERVTGAVMIGLGVRVALEPR